MLPKTGLVAFAIVVAMPQAAIDQQAAVSFVRDLQRAVEHNDRNAIASMIRFPLTAWAGSVRIPLYDAGDLRASYDAVFSPALKLAIASATLPRRGGPTQGAALAITAGSVTIGGDAVTIEPVAGRLRITGLHVPLAAPTAKPQAGINPPTPGGNPPHTRAPRRLELSFGRIEHNGTLGRGGREAFLIPARKNQTLDARITGVSGRDVVLYLVNAKTRAAVDAKAQSGVRTWVGRLPEDGEYRLEIARLSNRGDSRLPYVLVLSLR